MCTETVWLESSIPPRPQSVQNPDRRNHYPAEKYYLLLSNLGQAPVVQKVDKVIHLMNLHPVNIAQLVSQMVDSAIHLFNNPGQDPSMIFFKGNSLGLRLLRILFVPEVLGPVAQMLDSAIHRINLKY